MAERQKEMRIAKRISEALVESELTDALNEAALSRRARSFMNLIKSVIGLDANSLIKLATGKQTGLAETARYYKYAFIKEDVGQVQTLATGSNYRAVSVNAGGKTYHFLAPKRGNNKDYTDTDVIQSLHGILTKMRQAQQDGNTSALNAFKQTFLQSAEAATQALNQKEQQRGGQVQGTPTKPSSTNLVKVLTPIVVQMAGKDGPAAAAVMEAVTDEEIIKAVSAHIWDQGSITEYARLAWAAAADTLDGTDNDIKTASNSLAQTAVAYITYKYLYVKAKHAELSQDKREQQNKAQQEITKQQEQSAKQDEIAAKQAREQEKHERDGETHQLELEKKAAEVRKREAEIEKTNAQAEAAAKRPL